MCVDTCKNNSCCGVNDSVTNGWYSLPVAPRAFAGGHCAQVAGVGLLLPAEALSCLEDVIQQGTRVAVVDVSGPGDPLAMPGTTLDTLQMVHDRFPGLDLNITTLGIHGEKYAQVLAAMGLTYVTLQVDAIDVETVRNLYAWIRPGNKTIPLGKAVELLLEEQKKALLAFKETGCLVYIKTTVYPNCNDKHVEAIARQTAQLGADAMILVPCRTVDDAISVSKPDQEQMQLLADRVGRYFNTVIVEKDVLESVEAVSGEGALLKGPTSERPHIAVVSAGGVNVDLHLGQAARVLIYGLGRNGCASLLETRSLPESGGGDGRWSKLASVVDDCFVLLAAGAGEKPRKLLSEEGVSVVVTNDSITACVRKLYGIGKTQKCH